MQKIVVTGHLIVEPVNKMLSEGWRVISVHPTETSVYVVLEKEEENKNEKS